MKKLLTILLALMLCLCLCACGGGDDQPATGQPDQNQNQEQQQEPTGGDLSGYLGTKTGQFYSKFMDGKLYMKYETEMEGQKMTVITATSGDKVYSESQLDGIGVSASVMEGETMYVIDHTGKMVIKMGLTADAQTIAANVVEESDINMDDYKTGTREIDGKTYDTEEWVMEGTTSVMCFDGDELAYMIADVDGMEMIIKIIEISDKVDESLFEIPSDYTMMEM